RGRPPRGNPQGRTRTAGTPVDAVTEHQANATTGQAQPWSFHSKTVVVTGAANGMGARCAARLLEAGATVIAHDLDAQGIAAVKVRGQRCHELVTGDLCNPEAAENLLEATQTYGGPDALIHAAGVMDTKPFLDISLEDWRRMLEINLTASFSLVRTLGA